MAEKPTPTRKLSEKSPKQEMIEAAYQKVQDLAEKTVEGTSQAKTLADLQKLLVEQSRKGSGEKA